MLPNRAGLRTLALVVLVVLAGCGATTTVTTTGERTVTGSTASDAATPTAGRTATPTPSPTPTPTPTPTPVPVAVEVDGSLPVNATTVWTRVLNVTGATVQPPQVTVSSIETLREQRRGGELPPYLQRLGVRRPSDPVGRYDRRFGGLTFGTGVTYLYLGENVSKGSVECLMAHEFAHAVHFQQGVVRSIGDAVTAPGSNASGVDARLVVRGLKEGIAVAVQHAYERRYRCEGLPYAEWFYEGSPYQGYVAGPYVFGTRYVESQVASVRNLSVLTENPPTTTEQLIHPGSDDTPVPLTVETATPGTNWTSSTPFRLGELLTRVALSANISEQRAARAAAGWGNDALVRFARNGTRGWVWTLRWDDAGNASEFAAAFEAYLRAKGHRVDGGWVDARGTHWRLVRTGERTVAVVFGPAAFVDDVTVRGGETVTVTVDGETRGAEAVA